MGAKDGLASPPSGSRPRCKQAHYCFLSGRKPPLGGIIAHEMSLALPQFHNSQLRNSRDSGTPSKITP